MAKVPTRSAPEVLPEGPAAPVIDQGGKESDFGIIGRSLQRAGPQIDRGIEEFEKGKAQRDETAVNDVYSNDFSPKFRDLYQKYYALQGKDAVDQRGAFEGQMKELQQETRNGLTSRKQQALFDSMSRRRVEMELDGMARYADQQQKVWTDQTFDSTLKNLRTQASDKYNDERAFGTAIGSGQAEIDRYAQISGKSAEWARAHHQTFMSNLAIDRLSRWMLDDPLAANAWYKANSDIIDAQQRGTMEHHLKSAVQPVEAKQLAEGIIAGGTLNPSKDGAVLIPVAANQDTMATGQPAPQNKRDTRANLGNWISTAENAAERLHPGDPVFRDMVTQQVKGYVNTIVAAQDGLARQAHGQLITAALGENGVKPLTIDDLLNTPERRGAWALTDPQSQRGILALLEHNAREIEGRPIRTNPRVFEDLFRKVHLPEGDPNKIMQPGQLAPYLAKGLNRTDYDWLKKEIEQNQTADGQRLSSTRESFLQSIKPQFDKSTMIKLDEKGGEDFYKFKTYVLEQERAARADPKKNVYDLYNPTKPEYIGNQVPAFQRTLDQQLRDMADSLNRKPPTALPPEQQRKPGETPAQYLERMKGAKK